MNPPEKIKLKKVQKDVIVLLMIELMHQVELQEKIIKENKMPW